MTLSTFLAEISKMARCPQRSAADIDQITVHLNGLSEMHIPVARGDVDLWDLTKRKMKKMLRDASNRRRLGDLEIWFEPDYNAFEKEEDGGFDF